jgi:hypothetical protein
MDTAFVSAHPHDEFSNKCCCFCVNEAFELSRKLVNKNCNYYDRKNAAPDTELKILKTHNFLDVGIKCVSWK